MKNFKLILTALFSFTIVGIANAQFMHERDYKLITTKNYTDVEGSPYLYEAWMPGSVKLSSGVTNKEPIMLKYNLVDDEVYFKDKTGDMMAFVVPVREFTLGITDNDIALTKHYRSGYNDIAGSTSASFFEVLSDGKVQLIKKFSKMVMESQMIGSATKTKNFIEKTKYYLVINGKSYPVKNDKKAILTALTDKQAQLEAYLKTNKVDFKDDSQLGKVVDYYNTL